MKELIIIIRPEKLELVKEVLDTMHGRGMTISSVMGCGNQRGATEVVNEIKGFKTSINLIPKIKVEAVVDDKDVDDIMLAIKDKVSTGNVGDGKIFVRSIDDVMRLRTGERGKKAL